MPIHPAGRTSASPHSAAMLLRWGSTLILIVLVFTLLPAAAQPARALAQPAALPPFRATISTVSPTNLPYSWRAGCPVSPLQLRALHLLFYGFDKKAHLGTIVVNATVVSAVLAVFKRLYQGHFPIRAMQPVDVFHASDPASMAADNTSGFNCRYAVTTGPRQWSVHAYGEAIDVNPVENPYLEAGKAEPSAGAAFLNRTPLRPGMSGPRSLLNAAFASVGWQWGGRWSASPDYQHFSSTGG